MSLFANILAKALDFFLTHCEKTLYSIFKTKQSTELKTGQQIKVCLKMTFTWWTWKLKIFIFISFFLTSRENQEIKRMCINRHFRFLHVTF